MLRDVAINPSFPPDVVENERDRLLGAAPGDADDVERVTRRNLFVAIYGRSHPYARIYLRNEAELRNLTRDDIVRVWRKTSDPARATLVIAGDVDGDALRERVQSLFGGWAPDQPRATVARVPPPAPVASRLIVIDRPGARHAKVFFAAQTGPIDAPEHVAKLVVRELLGGMHSSAIRTKLRDELGFTWSGQAGINARPIAGVLWWEGSVPSDRTAAALAALHVRIAALRDSGPGAAELAAAKRSTAMAATRRFETAQGTTGLFGEIAAYGQPADFLATLYVRLEALPAEAVRAAVPAPDTMKAVVAGDLATLRAPLLALGWGPIAEHDADGNFVRTIGP